MENIVKFKRRTITIGVFLTIALVCAVILCTYDFDAWVATLNQQEAENLGQGIGYALSASISVLLLIMFSLIFIIGASIIVLVTTPCSFVIFSRAEHKVIKYINLGFAISGLLIFALCIVKLLLILL